MPNATDTSSKLQEAMENLTAQWYNAVVAGCQVDSNTFQLVQGSQPLGSTSEVLWNIADAVPPLSVTNLFDPSQRNSFSIDYGAVINNLVTPDISNFQNILGDYYSAWGTYLAQVPDTDERSYYEIFKAWAGRHLPPGKVTAACTAYQQLSQGTVPVAVEMWTRADGGDDGLKAYNATIAMLQNALSAASSKSVHMDSGSESSDTSRSWAKGNIGGSFDFFSASGSADYSNVATKLATSKLVIDASFERFVTFPLGPLSSTSSDPILSGYKPWYSSAALNLAYQHNDNTVWNHNPPTWNDTFGPSGNMLRAISALFVVDGITITTTSDALLTTTEQQQFKTAAKAGFWPFFKASASGGWSNDQKFSDQGALTSTSSSPIGNPVIFGATVTPIGDIL
jgi:hypothetical protein